MMDAYWLEQTEAGLPADNSWLSAGEVSRLSGMRFAKRQADWRLGRWTAKRALALYLHLPDDPQGLTKIEIRPAPSGAPEAFVADRPAPAVISLSHRAGVAACAVASPGAEIGCDLEVIEPRSDAFVADYFTAEEQALIEATPASDRLLLLALLWSAKESALKALRTGLRLDTRDVSAFPAQPLRSPNDDTLWRPLQVRSTGGQVFNGWWQNTGDLLRTFVALPPPSPPISLILP